MTLMGLLTIHKCFADNSAVIDALSHVHLAQSSKTEPNHIGQVATVLAYEQSFVVAHLVLDEGEEGVVEGLELLRLPDQCKALTICTAQRPPHVHCTHTYRPQVTQLIS